ncbi:MAG: response regulator [Planctomycetes bacterium]|nr:response regulator [Planctomycetota bacterium]
MANALAHDLNNTLSPVVGYAELLQGVSGLAPKHREWAAAIAQNASDAAVVVQKLQRFTAQRAVAAMERVDLREIVRQIPHLTRPKWKDEPQKSGCEIDFELRLSREPAPIGGDPAEIRQMLVNLVFNAVDAMPEGGTILIDLRSTDESVTMQVSDTGIGMNEEEQRRCLEPYYSTKTDGGGLGLSVSFGIVQRHGGSITLSSREGAGTTFEISFPRMAEIGTANRETPQPARSPAGKRILYIDDDERVRKSMEAILQAKGHEVDTAEDGPSGLSEFRKGDYDLVITDLGMPGMDGSEVVRAIKAMDPTFPVALISGWPPSDVAKRFPDTARPDWIIGKPASFESLQPALSSCNRPRP